MPIGLCNTPGIFARLMELVLNGLHWKIEIVREPELHAELSTSVVDDHNWEGVGRQTV